MDGEDGAGEREEKQNHSSLGKDYSFFFQGRKNTIFIVVIHFRERRAMGPERLGLKVVVVAAAGTKTTEAGVVVIIHPRQPLGYTRGCQGISRLFCTGKAPDGCNGQGSKPCVSQRSEATHSAQDVNFNRGCQGLSSSFEATRGIHSWSVS